MSCLLLKKTSDNLQKEVANKVIHEEVIGEIRYEQLLEGSSYWLLPDQPSCAVHGDCGERGGESASSSVKLQQGIWSSGKEELQAGVFTSNNDCQEFRKDVESSNVIAEPECHREQQLAWEEYIVDELVCKLISQLHCPSESSTICSQKAEVQDLNSQEGGIQGGSAEISKVTTPLYVEDIKGPLPIGLPERAVLNESCHRDPAKLRSALRGGYEQSGRGQRPRMNVTWAPDVYDPPCTSASHTTNQNRRRHYHHLKGDHRNRQRGKGSGHADSQKKSQKKLFRRLKHPGESFSSGSDILSQKLQQSSALRSKDTITPSLDDLKLKGSRVGPFISLQKACFLNPVLSLGESQLVTLDKIQGCHPRHLPAQELFV